MRPAAQSHAINPWQRPFRIIEPIMRRQLSRLIADDLARLRDLVEAET
jgi:hypothetical protein